MLQSGCFGGVDSKGEVHVTGRHSVVSYCTMFWVHEEMCYLYVEPKSINDMLRVVQLREERIQIQVGRLETHVDICMLSTHDFE